MARRQRYYFSDRLARRTRNIRICVIALFVIALSAGSAFSSEGSLAGTSPDFASSLSSSSLSATGSCLPLLKSIRQSPQSVSDRSQRSAGNNAAPLIAVGFVFGVRYALGPLEEAKPEHPAQSPANLAQDNDSTSDVRNALAVVAYRYCEKRQALAALD